jgi:hypothetical protein
VKSAPSAAIPLYERAIASGYATLAAYNNLAASYIDGSNQMTPLGRLMAAESALAKAHALDASSLNVHLNYVRLAINRAPLDASFDPVSYWQHAEPLIDVMQESEFIRWQLGAYWKRISERAAATSKAGNPASSDIEARLLDEQTRRTLIAAFDAGTIRSGGTPSSMNSSAGLSGAQACYIEPR